MPSSDYDPACLPDLLPLYYRRLFPFTQYYRWLNYGGGKCSKTDRGKEQKSGLRHRESFGDVWMNYLDAV